MLAWKNQSSPATIICKTTQETLPVDLIYFKKEIPGCNWWYPALWRLQKHVSSWALIWLEFGNLNSLWTKAQAQEKRNLVYMNTAAIRHLLMFYKGLPKFIKKYISFSAPFLRKGMFDDKDVLERFLGIYKLLHKEQQQHCLHRALRERSLITWPLGFA